MKNLHHLKKEQVIKYNSQQITNTIIKIQVLIDASISLLSQNKVMMRAHNYTLNLNPIKANLVNNIKIFNQCKHAILAENPTNETDPTRIKVHYLLSSISSYIDLTKISELPSFELKSLDSFQEEAWLLFDQLKELLKLVESL